MAHGCHAARMAHQLGLAWCQTKALVDSAVGRSSGCVAVSRFVVLGSPAGQASGVPRNQADTVEP